VAIFAGETVRAFLLPGEAPEIQLHLPDFVYAPVEIDTELGVADISVAGKSVGEVSLITKASVEIQPEVKSRWQIIKERITCGARPRT
jgi:hypothetical protein